MSRVVAVHGIAQQYESPKQLHDVWVSALEGGFQNAKLPPLAESDLSVVFWGDLFRDPAEPLKSIDPSLGPTSEVEEEFEMKFLLAMAEEATRLRGLASPSEEETEAVSKSSLRTKLAADALRLINELPAVRYLAERGALDGVLRGSLRQVATYLTRPAMRWSILDRFAQEIQPDTLVVIGHSLGSVIAYEGLYEGKAPNVRCFITLGSPLGIRGLVFDRLKSTLEGKPGAWPGNVKEWSNFADVGDVVALERDLRKDFSKKVKNLKVDNGAEVHSAVHYLTEPEVAHAIARWLD
jgi:hypothetical protein